MTLLTCTDLRRSYGDRVAVDGISFEVAAGERYGLLGPNGAGKTTTISMVAGLLDPDEGVVTVAGFDVRRDPARAKALVGLVPQDVALYGDLTGRENLEFFGRLYGLRGARLKKRTAEVLEMVGLSDRAGELVDAFSGGMRRRLNIGAGLLHEPQLLVLDEPTVGVDPQSRAAILEAIEQLDALSVLYTTHYMEEAERLCDRVGIIDDGKLIAEGTPRELVSTVGERDRVRIDATGDLDVALDAIMERVPESEVTRREDGFDVLVPDARRSMASVLAAVGSAATVSSVEVAEPNLEAVFLHLTGRALRD